MPDGIRSLAIRSAVVNFGASFFLKGLVLGQSILYARIFLPEDLGRIATVLLVTSFATLITRMGFEEAIVREKDSAERLMNTALTLAFTLGVGLYGALFLFAPLVAGIFHRTELATEIRVMGILIFSTPLILPNTFWARRFQFGLNKAGSLAELAFATTATLAFHFWAHAGLWSLFLGRLVGFAANYSTVWLIAPYRPRFEMDPRLARALARFGWPILVGSLANYVMHQGDGVLVRYFGGDANLAFYSLAIAFPYYLMEATDVLLGSLLPTFSRLQDDRARTISAFLQSNKYITLSIVPCGIFLAAAARPIVLLVFGSKWAPSVMPMTIMALAFTVQVMWGYAWGMLCLAWGKTRYLMYVKLWIVFYLLTAGVFMIRAWGTMGGAWYNLTQAILTVGIVRFSILARELGGVSFIRDSWKPIAAAALPGAGVWLLAPSVGNLPALLGVSIAYFAVYAALSVALDRKLPGETREILQSALTHRAGVS